MAKAANFAAAVALLGKAEALLVKAGQSTVERLTTLRGVYYGTLWSLDYDVESKRSQPGALLRNAGFYAYTGCHSPADPRPVFVGTTLLQDLKDSQSLKDGARSVDLGHLLIGVETRAGLARTTVFPEGGTGLEVVTWMGDLGGGAANLARRRARAPSTTVEYVFHNSTSDYGVTDNLEGDVAGYCVAAGASAGGVPAFGSRTIADAVKSYLLPITSSSWKSRAADFTKAIGGVVSGKSITNASDLINSLTAKLTAFGYWYASTRWIPTGELVGTDAQKTCVFMPGAAKEIATVFVATLQRAIASAPAAIDAAKPYPPPSGPGTCGSRMLQAAGMFGTSVPFS